MPNQEQTSKSAKILYRPVGLVAGMVSGALAGLLFRQVWKRVSSNTDEAPSALKSEFPLREVLLAAAIQGAIYAFVKAIVDRGGARAFQKLTGEWPGD